MGCLVVLVALGAVASNWGQPLAPVAIILATLILWTQGIAANYRSDPQNIPDWAARVSMAAFAVGIVLIVLGFFVRPN